MSYFISQDTALMSSLADVFAQCAEDNCAITIYEQLVKLKNQ